MTAPERRAMGLRDHLVELRWRVYNQSTVSRLSHDKNPVAGGKATPLANHCGQPKVSFFCDTEDALLIS
ncbi:hypothetical protein [Micromonospora aurantiaca (nom. illeg.)]|uniref:hypothetical protein n=1 Tax=Micromonospora aurantiaca (nom. illeg.) TaxID=47850 RepID=UPI0001BF1023|nr:hypothetical protein [Micromonospora aurantiaca]